MICVHICAIRYLSIQIIIWFFHKTSSLKHVHLILKKMTELYHILHHKQSHYIIKREKTIDIRRRKYCHNVRYKGVHYSLNNGPPSFTWKVCRILYTLLGTFKAIQFTNLMFCEKNSYKSCFTEIYSFSDYRQERSWNNLIASIEDTMIYYRLI